MQLQDPTERRATYQFRSDALSEVRRGFRPRERQGKLSGRACEHPSRAVIQCSSMLTAWTSARVYVEAHVLRHGNGTGAKELKRLRSPRFALRQCSRLAKLLDTLRVLLLKPAQTAESVRQFLAFLVVRCHANSFLDAVKNRVTGV